MSCWRRGALNPLSRWPLSACRSGNYCALTARPCGAACGPCLRLHCAFGALETPRALRRIDSTAHPSIHRCVRNSNLRLSPVLSVDSLSKHRKIRFGCGTLFIPVHSLTMGETVGCTPLCRPALSGYRALRNVGVQQLFNFTFLAFGAAGVLVRTSPVDLCSAAASARLVRCGCHFMPVFFPLFAFRFAGLFACFLPVSFRLSH
jgi:hypothetical protein